AAGPHEPSGRHAVGEGERGERDQPEERAQGRARGELRTMLEREDERDGTGRQGKAGQPSSDRGAPAAPGQRGEQDEERRQEELEHDRRRHGHYGLTPGRSCPPPRLTRWTEEVKLPPRL